MIRRSMEMRPNRTNTQQSLNGSLIGDTEKKKKVTIFMAPNRERTNHFQEKFCYPRPWRLCIISAAHYFKYKNSKTIYICLLSQLTTHCILWCQITTAIKSSILLNEFYRKIDMKKNVSSICWVLNIIHWVPVSLQLFNIQNKLKKNQRHRISLKWNSTHQVALKHPAPFEKLLGHTAENSIVNHT